VSDLSQAIRDTLLTPDSRAKVMATRRLVRAWRAGHLPHEFSARMPERPRWPDRLQLLPASQMPRRAGGGSAEKRIALWHALAHIEFVAIDLALDMIGRFGAQMDREFSADFLAVAADEAMHFALLERKLAKLGAAYGDLPVHDGLWQAAMDTSKDVAARLAVVPMVLEARGLDVTPAMIERVRMQGDDNGARILSRILDDEIRHVAAGSKHFSRICVARREIPANAWKRLVKLHFRGRLKAPFNDSARESAGLPREYYAVLA